jgi:hypothetical protein
MDLSPPARRVFDAYSAAIAADPAGWDAEAVVVAALRAVADPEARDGETIDAAEVYSIADELEGLA